MELASEMAVFARVVAATGIGMLRGLERELADELAGLRTQMLLTGAVRLLILLGEIVLTEFTGVGAWRAS